MFPPELVGGGAAMNPAEDLHQELERTFRGADWNVLKVIWGGGWDGLLAQDVNGTFNS